MDEGLEWGWSSITKAVKKVGGAVKKVGGAVGDVMDNKFVEIVGRNIPGVSLAWTGKDAIEGVADVVDMASDANELLDYLPSGGGDPMGGFSLDSVMDDAVDYAVDQAADYAVDQATDYVVGLLPPDGFSFSTDLVPGFDIDIDTNEYLTIEQLMAKYGAGDPQELTDALRGAGYSDADAQRLSTSREVLQRHAATAPERAATRRAIERRTRATARVNLDRQAERHRLHIEELRRKRAAEAAAAEAVTTADIVDDGVGSVGVALGLGAAVLVGFAVMRK